MEDGLVHSNQTQIILNWSIAYCLLPTAHCLPRPSEPLHDFTFLGLGIPARMSRSGLLEALDPANEVARIFC
jgi:hypothetical protein